MTRDDIVREARSLCGVPFLWQGRDESTGLDCAGVIVALARRLNYPIKGDRADYGHGRTSFFGFMLAENFEEIGIDEARPGDIYLMLRARQHDHAAVKVTEDDWIVHAYTSEIKKTCKVLEQPIDTMKRSVVRAFRFRGLSDV